MKITDPDLLAHVNKCMRINVGEIEDDVKRIMALMDAVSVFSIQDNDYADNESWQPRSERMKEIVSLLIAPENRDALRKWYRPGAGLNETAQMFKGILCRMTGEEL
jgi:hypothetical protein